MSDFDLFAFADTRARRTDPHTSHEAAQRVTFAAAHYRAIKGAFGQAEHYGDGTATIYQIAAASGLTHVQVARRLPEMQSAGLVEPTGTTAPGPTGRQCRLWRAR